MLKPAARGELGLFPNTVTSPALALTRSPTDMGINAARQGIVDMPVCVAASVREIESRMARYKEEIGEDCDAVQRCRKLLEEAKAWQHTVGS